MTAAYLFDAPERGLECHLGGNTRRRTCRAAPGADNPESP